MLVAALGLSAFFRIFDISNRGVLGRRVLTLLRVLDVPARVQRSASSSHGAPGVRAAPGGRSGSTAARLCVVLGFVVNRLNVSITGFEGAQGGHYIPSWTEVMITLMLVAIGFAAFSWIARNFPVYPEEEHEPAAAVLEPTGAPMVEATAPWERVLIER